MDDFTNTQGRRGRPRGAKRSRAPLTGRAVRFVGLFTLAAASSFVLGCGASIGGYCAAAAECEGGNAPDEDACNTRFNELQDLADLKNCTDEYDAWFECVAEESRCNDDRYVTDEDVCGSEEDQFQRCADIGGL
ncbi:MAG: hypothetical protein U0271_32430 [Polyangiaceae bacterium]